MLEAFGITGRKNNLCPLCAGTARNLKADAGAPPITLTVCPSSSGSRWTAEAILAHVPSDPPIRPSKHTFSNGVLPMMLSLYQGFVQLVSPWPARPRLPSPATCSRSQASWCAATPRGALCSPARTGYHEIGPSSGRRVVYHDTFQRFCGDTALREVSHRIVTRFEQQEKVSLFTRPIPSLHKTLSTASQATTELRLQKLFLLVGIRMASQ